jgi:polar amino acid transport system ATP-binding protein
MPYSTKNILLQVKDVSVGYDGKAILKDINFTEMDVVRTEIDSTGQVIAFIGRSGRGKSTLFKALTGLLKPLSGEMLINDLITSTEEKTVAKIIKEGDIGFVDQKYTLFRHKTIWQICQYVMRKSKLSKAEKDTIINDYLVEWGLLEHKNKFSCELSGGQRQRTAIIEQMLSDKHFMIFDEPFSGLDVGNIQKVKESFYRIGQANEHNTIIFSTHDIRLAVNLADSIYILGFPEGTKDYSTIVKHYDLKQMGLAWTEYGDKHRNLVEEIEKVLLAS